MLVPVRYDVRPRPSSQTNPRRYPLLFNDAALRMTYGDSHSQSLEPQGNKWGFSTLIYFQQQDKESKEDDDVQVLACNVSTVFTVDRRYFYYICLHSKKIMKTCERSYYMSHAQKKK